MKTNFRTLNDLTVEELRGLITDLQCGMRYNDIKAKYQTPSLIFTADTISTCENLISAKRQAAPITTTQNDKNPENTKNSPAKQAVKVPEHYRKTLPWLFTPIEELKLPKNSYHPDVDNYNVF